ncbi:MAG: T9SS type A sorting domain-containing protein [Lewinellaceae bacterium]|nr:T9SS type A sorting domain-containing protein [Lewinellaceae bacterium]
MNKSILIALFFAFAGANISAQCFLDRHNTTWFDSWISCTASMNPNPVRGESHWIMYNLNDAYELFQMHIWNANAPEYLTDGMNNIVIDISNDGVSWTEAGVFQIPMADGTSIYEGLDLFDFEGASAQYVLITGLSNHGGSCFGLSEIRIDVADAPIVGVDEPVDPGCLSASIFPNPVTEASKAIISSHCSNATIYYSIRDISGKTIKSGEITPVSNEVELDISSLPIVAGSYILSLQQLDLVRRVKIVKVE